MNLRAEAIAAELLERAQLPPGASMRLLAAKLGITVVRRNTRGFAGTRLSKRAVLVSPSGYGPRDEFTLAHELAELFIPADWHRDLPNREKEKLCNRIAAALLLPPAAFAEALESNRLSLNALRQRFPRASCETIVTRIVDLSPASHAAAWIDGRRIWRRGGKSGENVAAYVRAERKALKAAEHTGVAHVEQDGARISAWRLSGEGGETKVAVTVVERQ